MKFNPEEVFEHIDHIRELAIRFEKHLKHGEIGSLWLDSEDIEDLCNHYIDRGIFEMADKVLQLGESLHPTDESINMLKARLLIEQQKPQEALCVLDELQYTDDFYWHYLRVTAYIELADVQKAQQEADEALHCERNNMDAILDVARVFTERGHHEAALRYLLMADNGVDTQPELFEAIVKCLYELNRLEEALPYAERLIDQDPYSLEAWQLKASIHIDMGKYDLALEDLEYAIVISPNDIQLQLSKVKLLFTLDRNDEALDILTETEKNAKKEWKQVCLMLRGDYFFLAGDYKTAHSHYHKGFNRNCFYSDSAFRYMECEMVLHKWKEAIKIGTYLLDIGQNNVRILEMLADAGFELRQLEYSAKMLRRALKLEPDNVALNMRYGSLLLDLKDYKKAYTAIHRAYRIAPEYCATNILMAVVCYLKEDIKRMYRYYRQACKIDESSRNVLLQICPDLKDIIDKLDELTRRFETDDLKI